MRSEWRISCQYFGEKKIWQVYYLRDINEVDHSGNRIYVNELFETLEEAEELAERLNAENEDM